MNANRYPCMVTAAAAVTTIVALAVLRGTPEPEPAPLGAYHGQAEIEHPKPMAIPSDTLERRSALPSSMEGGFYAAPVGTIVTAAITSESTTLLTRQHQRAGELRTRIEGTMTFAIASRRGDELLAAVRFPNTSVALFAPKEHRIPLATDAPMFVHLRDDGTLLGYRYPNAVAPEIRDWQEGLVRAFVLVVRPEAAEWTVTDPVPGGTQEWRYAWRERPDRGGTGTLVRVAGALTGAGATVLDADAKASVVLGHGWLETLEFHMHSQSTAEGGYGFVATSSGRGQLLSREVGKVPSVDWDGTWSPFGLPSDQPARHLDVDAMRYAEELRGATLEGLLAKIPVLGDAGGEPRELVAACRRIEWYLRLHPDTLATLEARLRAGALDAAIAGVALSAISLIGSAECLAALDRMTADVSMPENLRIQVLRSRFGARAGSGGAAVVAGVASDSGAPPELRGTAMLLLGDFVAHGGDDSGIGRLLAIEMDLPPELRVDWLTALGNCRSPLVAEVAAHYCQDEAPDVRAAALFALREAPAECIASLIRQLASHDPDTNVRARAVNLLASRSDDLLVLSQLLADEPSVAVRGAGLQGLANRAPSPGLRELVAAIANGDTSTDLRERARQLLQRLPA